MQQSNTINVYHVICIFRNLSMEKELIIAGQYYIYYKVLELALILYCEKYLGFNDSCALNSAEHMSKLSDTVSLQSRCVLAISLHLQHLYINHEVNMIRMTVVSKQYMIAQYFQKMKSAKRCCSIGCCSR